MFDIKYIQLHFSTKRVAVSAIYLGHSGDSRLDGEHSAFIITVFFDFGWQVRSRAYYAHISHQNIEKIWQLVDAVFSHPCTNFRHPRIIINLEQRTIHSLVFFHDIFLFCIRIMDHGSKLEQSELFSIFPYTLADIDRIASRIQNDNYTKQYKKRESDQK